jgi:23S rRNA pseudouridine1911/1915/1917 synthase
LQIFYCGSEQQQFETLPKKHLFKKNSMSIIAKHIISTVHAPTRLSDYAIGIFPELPSRKSVKKAIKADRFLVDNKVKNTGYWVETGKTIELLTDTDSDRKIFPRRLAIVFEDDFLAVINKPAGLPVSGNFFKTVVNTLSFNLKKSNAVDTLSKPIPVHRLDGLTSGLLLISKTSTASIHLGQQFENQQITKQYQALVMGDIPKNGIIDIPIDNKESLTHFEVEKSINSLQSGQLSLVNLFPKTGRTHQLRIHLASIGCPILGDSLYGKEGQVLKGKGLFLSAIGLIFRHPISNEMMNIKIDAPNKFSRRMELEEKRWEKFNH